MAAQIWIGSRTRAEFLRRLAIVFANELCLRIVTELYIREMSPTLFYNEIGGDTQSRVSHNFRRLVKSGWLRQVRIVTGGKRRGGIEHFYRSTELAIFDHETWAMLPYSLRAAFSWTILRQLEERYAFSESSTSTGGLETQIRCDEVTVDEIGWSRIVAALDAVFMNLFEEQRDSRLRVERSGDRAIVGNVAMFGFESAQGGSRFQAPRLTVVEENPLVPFPQRVSKVLPDPLALRILDEANLRDVSAPLLHAEIGGNSRDDIRRRVKMLEKLDLLQMSFGRSGGQRRGATEKFYRATSPALVDTALQSLAGSPSHASSHRLAFERFSNLAREAMRAGTFDGRTDRYATWSALRLDQIGWERTAQAVADISDVVDREAEESERRQRRFGGPTIPIAVGLGLFETPHRIEIL